MRTQILSLLFFLFSVTAGAEALLKLDRKVSAFRDFSTGSLLLISPDGNATWWNDNRVVRSKTYKIEHPDCAPLSQNTTSMSTSGGLTLAFPFLVGIDRICYIDEDTGVIRRLSNFSKLLPESVFSASFAGFTDDEAYFLLNGRSLEAPSGFILLLKIDLKTLKMTLTKVLTEVPGYSAAMYYDDTTIWISTYPSVVYKVNVTDLHRLVSNGGSVSFNTLATRTYRMSAGLNSYVLKNDGGFLYYNPGYDSYTFSFKDLIKRPAAPPCEPVAGFGDGWLILCNGDSLQSWKP